MKGANSILPGTDVVNDDVLKYIKKKSEYMVDQEERRKTAHWEAEEAIRLLNSNSNANDNANANKSVGFVERSDSATSSSSLSSPRKPSRKQIRE